MIDNIDPKFILMVMFAKIATEHSPPRNHSMITQQQ